MPSIEDRLSVLESKARFTEDMLLHLIMKIEADNPALGRELIAGVTRYAEAFDGSVQGNIARGILTELGRG